MKIQGRVGAACRSLSTSSLCSRASSDSTSSQFSHGSSHSRSHLQSNLSPRMVPPGSSRSRKYNWKGVSTQSFFTHNSSSNKLALHHADSQETISSSGGSSCVSVRATLQRCSGASRGCSPPQARVYCALRPWPTTCHPFAFGRRMTPPLRWQWQWQWLIFSPWSGEAGTTPTSSARR